MAKKTGGLNLAGSADPSIVQAATRMGMAGIPKDLSKAFSMVATGYSQQMAAFGQAGAKLGQIAGQLAGPLVDKAIDNIQFEYSKSIKNPGDIPQPSIDAHMDLNKQIKGMLKSDDATIVEEGKNLKAQWMYNADRIRAGLMTVDFTAGGALSDAMRDGQYNNDLLFYNASQFKGAPISADSGLPKEYHGVQMLPVINDGKIKYGLFKDGKPVSGISKTGEIQYAGEVEQPQAYVMQHMDGSLKKGDVLTEEYISNLKNDQLKTKARDYNLLYSGSLSPDSIKHALFGTEDKTKSEWLKSEDNVKQLQQDLIDEGYELPKYGVDGKMGEETRNALQKYRINFHKSMKEQGTERQQYVLGVDDFGKNIVTESAFRAPMNAFTGDIIKNAQKGGKFDETMLKNSILSLKVDGKSITSKDIEDMSHFLFPGVTETFADHLGKINPTTAAAYIEANPSILSNLKDITGDGKVDQDDMSLEVGSDGFANILNGMKKDKNAFADWYTGELKKKHKLNLKAPPPPSSSDQYEMPGGQYTGKARVDRDVKLLNQDPNTIPRQTAWNGLTWRKQNGQYQVFDTDKEVYVNTTKEDLIINLKFDETVGYKTSTSSTSKMTIQEANNILAGTAGVVSLERIEEAKAVLGVQQDDPIYKGYDPNNLSGKKLLD